MSTGRGHGAALAAGLAIAPRLARGASLSLAASLALAGCSSSPNLTITPVPAEITVAAGFYPLQFVAERVGGAHVSVTALAPPGVEPHDLELSPSAVRGVRSSDVVLYLSGFQPAVDDAIASTGANALDASASVTLRPSLGGVDVALDPHFWLDPTLLAAYAGAVGADFAALDPANATDYLANAAALEDDLTALDASYSSGLATCQHSTILVSHDAFGYLAARYRLTQVGLSGLDPEAEPTPFRIREMRTLAKASGATTIFIEPLVDPSVVEAFAADAQLAVATLDPVESLVAVGNSGDSAGDYLTVMTRNLTTLEAGLGC
jgi:zinc transport system substrate-binding protein